MEEKRRLKQLQLEKEREDEAKAEERFRREQQKIMEINEMEKRKQQEQEVHNIIFLACCWPAPLPSPLYPYIPPKLLDPRRQSERVL